MSKHRQCILLILILLSPWAAWGSEDSLKTYRSSTVVQVRHSLYRALNRTATSQTVMDSTLLAQELEGSLADLLGKHSPLFIKSYGQGSTATVSFRGTAASHTQVEWNGININNPMMGQVDFSMLPVWFVDRVELLHGGSSLQNGSGALGGTVTLGSKPRWNDKLYGSVAQGFGSFGSRQTFGSVGGGGKKVHARVRYFWDEAENDFKFQNIAVPPFEKTRQQNASYRKQGALGDLYWNAGKENYLSLHVWYHHANRDLPPIMSYEGTGQIENQKDDEWRSILKWAKYGDRYTSELTTGFSTTRMDYLLSNQTELGLLTRVDSRNESDSYLLRYRLEYNFGQRTLLRLLANGAYHKVEANDRATLDGYDANRKETGLSASLHHRFNSAFSGYVLLREELNSRRHDGMKFSPLMPSVGLEFSPQFELRERHQHYLSFWLNATRNYHQPTLNDLYWIPGGNPDLDPEKGYTFDIGSHYEYHLGKLILSGGVTGFFSWIDDWIVWRPSEYRYWTAENIKEVFSRGVEVSLGGSYTLPAGLTVRLKGNYAYTRTTNEKPESIYDVSKGRQLIYIPEHKGSAMLDVNYRGFWINYLWTYTGERYTTSSNEPTRFNLPSYSLHDLAIGGKVNFWKMSGELQFKINNLFDKDYQAILWRAMPGRNYHIQVRLNF